MTDRFTPEQLAALGDSAPAAAPTPTRTPVDGSSYGPGLGYDGVVVDGQGGFTIRSHSPARCRASRGETPDDYGDHGETRRVRRPRVTRTGGAVAYYKRLQREAGDPTDLY